DERIQELFGRILAGEILQPGTFSKATLRIVNELTQEVAQHFEYIWERSIDDWLFRSSEFEQGQGWVRIIKLQDAGLLATSVAATFRPEGPKWQIGSPPVWLLLTMKSGVRSKFPIINLTKSAVELGRILPARDIKKNLRFVSDNFRKD